MECYYLTAKLTHFTTATQEASKVVADIFKSVAVTINRDSGNEIDA